MSWHVATASRVENATRITNTVLITMLHRPLKTQSALVGKDDDEETVAHNVKPLLSRLGGLISNGYNWKPSFALLVAKKRAWCIESRISGRVSRSRDMSSLC